jgi:alpha-ribazole phosphatase
MTVPTRWWWIRHAPVCDGADRIQGQRDVDCDCADDAPFKALAEGLPGDAIWMISGLKRTRQTLDALRAFLPAIAEPAIEPDFKEQNFGRWQGLSWSEMQARDPELYRRFWEDPTRNVPPGGESFARLIDRVGDAIARLGARFAGRDIVVVGHGGTIRAAVAVALDLTPQQAMAIVVDNLSLTRLDHMDGALEAVTGGAWRVRGVNVRCPWAPPAAG